MGKITTIHQRTASELKKLTTVVHQFVASLKKGGVKVGDVEIIEAGLNELWVSIDCSEANQCTINDFNNEVRSKTNLVPTSTNFREGQYMWDADTYIRPAVFGYYQVK